MNNTQDELLWAAVVDAEKQTARVRADFYQKAESRRSVLAKALHGSVWDRGAAMSFLLRFPGDVPAHLDSLVELAMTHSWALAAKRAIVSNPAESARADLRGIVNRKLETADGEDYRRLAELLRYVNDQEALGGLVDLAARSSDAEIREVGDDFRRR